MPNRDDILRDRTFKGHGGNVSRRVFYTLTDDKTIQGERTTKLVALLIARLHANRVLDDAAIDDLLFDCLY